jgi:FAD/FMN-containing dehydrogenase
VNLGIHCVIEPASGGRSPAVDAWTRSAMERLAQTRVIPYRWGRHWGEAMGHKVDPVYRQMLERLKQLFDPDGILHPGASLWGES